MSAFLGIEHSLTGRRWAGPSIETARKAEMIAQRTPLPVPLCNTLARLGVPAIEAETYLKPKLRDLMPDPKKLNDMDVAVRRFLTAVEKKEKIAIFADYDVDGACSAALVFDWLRQMDISATIYIPDRIDEGYGPNEAAMSRLAESHDLIICVDCGTQANTAIDAAIGADVIVLDHHLGGEVLPNAVAVVNPNRHDESGELSHLCATAVVFLVLVAVERSLRGSGRFGPDLMSMLDLVALATVADVVPLTGVNRAFVHAGLHLMSKRRRPGLAALSDIAKIERSPSSHHLGFVLGPRINAGGRVGRADLGARLLTCVNLDEAQSLAEMLDRYNDERRQIQNDVTASAMIHISSMAPCEPIVWAAKEGWHPGVVGIVASRIKEAANRPAIVIGLNGDVGKGSGRSVPGIDLGFAIQKLVAEDLLIKGGGHRMAAGMTVHKSKLEAAMERLSEIVASQQAGKLERPSLDVDGLLMPDGATRELVKQIESAGPYGSAAREPCFAFPNMKISFTRRVSESHMQIRFSDGVGTGIDGIAFGAYDGKLGTALENHGGDRFHLAGKIGINSFRGKNSVQMQLIDAANAI